MKKNPFIGKWQITKMEQWDSDFINEEEEGYIEFGKDWNRFYSKAPFWHCGMVEKLKGVLYS